ncbi:MAG: polysaccharide deacetylase family protein [Acidobacteria bacterium]|jgi:polysaccharide deacetylase family protein (PEP-CTERM system associated)|nr:polysaccharide deacetylase family protein [Acidobacteriota bacterium]
MTAAATRPAVILTINVRDYFQASAFAGSVRPQDWDWYPSRYEQTVSKLLDLFAAENALATFFVLGWHARNRPAVVRRIAEAGHEVACSGTIGRPLADLTVAGFTGSVAAARDAIEDAAGVPVAGWRAPAYALHPRSTWVFEVLESLGFTYDSSLAPRGPRRAAPYQPPAFRIGDLWEVPPSRVNWFGKRFLPDTGSLRHLPFRFYRRLLEGAVGSAPTRPVLCLSSWEFDADQPRLYAPTGNRWLHYRNLGSTDWKLKLLLQQYRVVGVMDAICGGAMAAAGDSTEVSADDAYQIASSGPVVAAPRSSWWRVTP